MRIFPYTLYGRFLACLALAMILMGLFFVLMLRVHTRELLIAEAREKANLMTSHAEAIQRYVRDTLRPAVAERVGADGFVIEAMSTSFATRHILSYQHTEGSSFEYRRVAKNARNPDYEVNEEEKAILTRFREEPLLTRLETKRGDGDAERLIIARPVRFTAECMRCHGAPEAAPAVLLEMYGDTRGFNKVTDELSGLDIISVSMQNTSTAVRESVTMFGMWFGFGMLILFCTVQGFFNRLVVHNLRRVGGILQRLFFSNEGGAAGARAAVGTPDPEVMLGALPAPENSQDDIEGMVRSIETVAQHLAGARRALSDYARNLETMVEDRTADLASVAAARNADVQLFITLLSGLNKSHEKKALLQASLKLIAGHFGAERALYVCGGSGLDHAAWPPGASPGFAGTAIGERLADPGSLLTLEEPELHESYWLLPVQSSGNTRGILGLFWPEKAPPSRPDLALALAFSRQLGIALDNLDALDTLLRQNSLLDSLVEGVPDPLLLAEGAHCTILANSSAKNLAEELAREDQENPGASAPAQAARPSPERNGTGYLLKRFSLGEVLIRSQEEGVPAHEDVTLANGRSFALGVYPLSTAGAASRRSIIHIRETTSEKQMMLQMRRSEKLAAVGQLAAGLAHEINNPLGVIRCYAELLSPSATGKQEADDIQVILHHVDQAQSVLRDLLDFSRPHAADISDCDLLEFIPSMSEFFKAKAAKSRVSLRLDMPPRLPVIQTDKGMLEQVLINLLLNSLDAVPPERGVITLGAETRDGSVTISVTDNGPGIDEAATVRIFDPFYTTKSSGTGLGLSVAFGIAREMGGSIEVQNTYLHGRRSGVTFSVVLPIAPAA